MSEPGRTLPSPGWGVAQGMTPSDSVAQPWRPRAARTATSSAQHRHTALRRLEEDRIAILQRHLLPVGQDVGDHEVLLLDDLA